MRRVQCVTVASSVYTAHVSVRKTNHENILQGTHKARPRYTMARQATGGLPPGDLSVETGQDLHKTKVHAEALKTLGDQYGHLDCGTS